MLIILFELGAGMQEYHMVWLREHPNRTSQWLGDKLADGFHIHHIDGNHTNNASNNLVLIDGQDHFFIHNGSKRPVFILGNSIERIRRRLWITPCKQYYIKLKRGERRNVIVGSYRQFPHLYTTRLYSVGLLTKAERVYYEI